MTRVAAIAAVVVSLLVRPAPAPAASDAAIEREIAARFARSKIGEDGFRVSVRNGVATLEGKTEVVQRKGVATRLAKLGGARAVVNRIEVSAAGRAKAAEKLRAARAKKKKKEPAPAPRLRVKAPPEKHRDSEAPPKRARIKSSG